MSGDVTAVDEWTKPLPQPDAISGPYWQAAAEGRLLIQECPKCGNRQWYPRALCTKCGADPEWLETAGRGTLHTFTIVRQNGARPFRDELPYAVGMVELDEGPMIFGGITDCPVDDVHIGMALEVHFLKATDDVGIPYWRPAKS